MAQLTAKQKALVAAALLQHLEAEFPETVKLAIPVGPAGAGGAGETIAQQAAAAGKLKPGAGHSPPKKVATPKGAAHYHVPLGALIIPHVHYVHGQPSHWIHNVSQAKWVANQWKDHPDKDDAAKAVESGTHKWVQAGQSTAAVHKDVDVHVPKGTDIHDEGAVKNAPKVLVKHHPEEPEKSEHVVFSPHDGLGKVVPHSEGAKNLVDKDWKKLPEEKPKKAVHIHGKHAAWVPHDWQVHKKANTPEDQIHGKFAKDPEGNWHFIGPNGLEDPKVHSAEEWAKSGAIVPEDQPHEVHPDHVTPNQPVEGASDAKVDVGGVSATKDQIQDAINILNSKQSTNVKGPLKNAGNPLWEMDYTGISEKELAQFPELKVEAGTKKKHVGKVKLAVLHHLAGKLEHLAKTEAEAKHQAEVQAKAKADAEHAQKLTPAAKNWGGVDATAAQLSEAAQWLEQTMGGKQSFKQAMNKLGNPLANADYMGASKAYLAEHPNTAKGWSTKKLMLESILDLQGQAAAQDEETGHPAADALHTALTTGQVNWAKASLSGDGAVAQALVMAAKGDEKFYAQLSPSTPGMWSVKPGFPPPLGKAYYEATPDHNVFLHMSGGTTSQWSSQQVEDVVKDWVKPKGEPEPEAPKPEPKPEPKLEVKPGEQAHIITPEPPKVEPKPEPEVKPLPPSAAVPTKEWAKNPEWEQIHALALGATTESANLPNSTENALAIALWQTAKLGVDRWLKASEDGSWVLSKFPPQPGTWGAQTVAGSYRILADHQIIHVDKEGNQTAMPADAVLEIAQNLAPKEPEPKPAAPELPVIVQGNHKGTVPAGSTFWVDESDSQANPKYLYVKLPDGTWKFASYAKGELGDSANSAETLNAGIANGDLKPYGSAAEAVAKADKAPVTAPSEPPPDDGLAAEPAQDMPVMVKGKEVGKVPAGSKFYHGQHVASGESNFSFVKKPDGTWVKYGADGLVDPGIQAAKYDPWVQTGTLVEHTPGITAQAPEKPAEPKAEPEPVKPAEVPAPPAPTGEPIPVIKNGVVMGTVPAGSKLYAASGSSDVSKIKKPDGKWAYVGSSTIQDYTGNYDSQVENGKLKEVPPPTGDQLAKAQVVGKLKDLVNKGAVTTSKVKEGADPWGYLVWQLTSKSASYHYGGIDVWKNPTYGWQLGTPYNGAHEYWSLDPKTLEGTHHKADGTTEPVPFETVKNAIEQHVQPNSVELGGKVYKHGFYYNPKGKAYLEIKPSASGAYYYSHSKADYIWHQVNGTTKELTHYGAQTKLEQNTEYHAEPKPVIPAAGAAKVLPTHATVAQPGAYPLFSTTEKLGVSKSEVTIHADGSGSYYKHEAGTTSPLNQQTLDALIMGGTLVDKYGNSVVKPGVEPQTYHLFGLEGKDKAALQEFKTQLEQATQGGGEWTTLVMNFFGGKDTYLAHKDQLQAFFNDKLGAITGQAQRQALIALVNELLTVPANAGAAFAEPKFLKSVPAGIGTSKKVFEWTEQGYAKPYSGVIPKNWALTADSTQLSDKIKAISAEFGGGQVVGTHLSGLTKPEKQAWLDAWKTGNMTQVFNLDAKAGKVSPVHPGAPKNTDTHKIHWSPWDPAQVPATKEIEGTWSSVNVQPTKAEVDNYLIKAGLQHAAYLTLAQRRQWMKAHRQHDQETVDTLSRQAHDAFTNGEQAKSEPPAWTENVQPAKSYTVSLEDNAPAAEWTYEARGDFVKEHKETLLPFAQQVAAENGISVESTLENQYLQAGIIQKYLDDKAAKELAEKLRPKYELAKTDPGEPAQVTDQYGHKYLWHTGTEKEMATRVAVYDLARAWGIKSPRAQLVKLEADGTPGVVTDLVTPTDGTLAHLPGGISSLSEKELADLAREHLFDHVVGNPSSTPGEYARVAGGITGTGKDGAFTAFLTWSGLDAKTMNQVTVQPVSLLTKAIADGQLSKAQADAAYIAAIRAARRMAQTKESRLAAILNTAGLPMNTQLEVFQRVGTLADDAQKFWDQVYATKGWAPPEVPVNKLPLGLYSGFSEPGLIDHVMAAKAAGVPAFFAGPHLEDANFLVWTEKAGNNRYLRGESTIRGNALDQAIAWAEQHQTGSAAEAKPKADVPTTVHGTSTWHSTVLAAAKAVSRHAQDQLWEGPVTKQALEGLASLKENLLSVEKQAEAALAKESENLAGYGHPYLVKHAAQYFLDQVAKVEHAKANALTFKPGDLPEWVAPEIPKKPEEEKPKVLPGIKVEYLQATRVLSKAQSSQHSTPQGDIIDAESELQLGKGIYEYPGYAWHITLPTGEVIELNDKGKTSSPPGHEGRVRFRAVAENGAQSLENIREQLQKMGVPLDEAAPEDMELFYWRHLAHILANRVDRQQGQHAQVWQTLNNEVPAAAKVSTEDNKVWKVAEAGLTPDQELAIWRKAWANLTSPEQVQQWVDKGGYLPHMPHMNVAQAEVPAGKPYWYRFDADPHFLAKRQLPGHSLGGSGDIPYWVATTGGLYSTEGRLRAEGVWVAGSSSATDMKTHGSAGVVYTRQNQEGSHHAVYISPRVLARTSVYGFNHDGWGDLAKRKNHSHFDLKSLTSTDTYETNIKDAIPLLDDIMILNAGSEATRSKIIAALKARGVHEIRGMKVEDRITAGYISKEQLDKVKAAEPDPSTWFSHPEEQWTPPHVTWNPAEHSIVESEEEKAAAKAATPAEEIVKAQALANHDQGAPVEKINQVFYNAPSKPPQNQLHQDKVQVKIDTGKRVAENMKSSTEDIKATADAAGINVPAAWGPTRQATVGAFIAVWAQSNTSILARAMQQVAHQLFGLQKDYAIKLPPDAQAEVDSFISSYGSVIEDFLLTQYNLTQEDLKKKGITHLTLYRGFNWASGSGPWGTQLFGSGVPDWAQGAKPGDTIDTPATKPFSSWAFEFPKGSNAMAEFTGHGPYTIVKTTVPASLVMSYPRSGMGSYWQYEFLILDSPGKWEVWQAGG